jgi:hypothetical protein
MDSMRLQSRTPSWMRFDLVGPNNPAIEDARLIAGFFLVIATDPGFGNRPSCPEQGAYPHRREGHWVKNDQ